MKFDFSTDDLSAILWRRLLRDYAWDMDIIISQSISDVQATEVLREQLQSPTGSIPVSTSIWLTLLARRIKPKRVFEIGTFIGRSLTAIARGMKNGTIITCDAKNGLVVGDMNGVSIECNPGRTSTAVLAEQTEPFDMFFIDGRLQEKDLSDVRRLSNPMTVYAFDDFEGTAKGVGNVMKMQGALRKENEEMMLVVPPDLNVRGIYDRSTLALLIPTTRMRFTYQ